jgi:1,4-dihydroxy-2-naphthoyl-CoA hydrolase
VHGGVWVAFADSVAAWGTYANLSEGQDFTTAELKANVFAAGRPGDVLHGFGRPLHVGRRTQVWEVRITRNEEDRNAAFFTCTQMLIGASASA